MNKRRCTKIGRRARTLTILLGTMLGCAGCTTIARDQIPVAQHGIWQSDGYGWILEMGPEGVRCIERTSVSCVAPERAEDLEALLSMGAMKIWMPTPDSLRATLLDKQTDYRFERIGEAELHQVCPVIIEDQIDDPELNFEIFWLSFNDNYPFFERRNVDWQAAYDRFRPRISQMTDEDELLSIMTEMVAPLEDGHVSIDGREAHRSVLERRLIKECQAGNEHCGDIERFATDRLRQFFRILQDDYLDGHWQAAFADADYIEDMPPIFWGELSADVGYLFFGLTAAYAGSEELAEDLRLLQPVLDRAMADLADHGQLVIDLRMNPGGHDEVGLALADRLTDRERLVLTKRAYDLGRLTEAQSMVIRPSERPSFRGEIAVLTSPFTASAAEILTMALRTLPNATLIGEPGEGVFSDAHGRVLPMGIDFELPNEIYADAAGQIHEAIGVIPDIPVIFLSPEDGARGVDSMLDRAIALFERQN